MQRIPGWFSRFILVTGSWAWLVGPALAAESFPQKFDLICHGSGRQIFQPYPPVRGTGETFGKGPWPVDRYFIVDLSTMNFCGDKYCSNGGHRKLAKMDNDRIFFTDKIGFHESVDLHSLKYVMQIEGDQGVIEASRAQCRFGPFSGFRW